MRNRTLVGRLAHLRDDRGVALPMVLLVFVVGVALVSAFLVAIVGSANVTVATKDGVQAQAAAEAGIAAAEAKLLAVDGVDPCNVTGVDGLTLTRPDWSYAVSRVCDIPADEAQPARLVLRSTGTAGDASATVEAAFEVTRGSGGGSSGPQVFTDTVVYAGGGASSEFDGQLRLQTTGGQRATVINRAATFTCTNTHTVPGDVLGGGGAQLGGCVIQGSLYLASSLSSTSGVGNQITGEVSAAGAGPHVLAASVGGNVTVNGDLTLDWGSDITGNVSATGNITIRGIVRGSVVAGGNVTVAAGGGSVQGSVRALGTGDTVIQGPVNGDLSTAGALRIDPGGTVNGAIAAVTSGRPVVLASSVAGDVRANGLLTVTWNTNVGGRIFAAGTVTLEGSNSVGAALPGCVVGSVTNQISWNQPPAGINPAVRGCQITASQLQLPTLTPPSPAQAPNITGWQALTYDPAAWTAQNFTIRPQSSINCQGWQGAQAPASASAWGSLSSVTQATVFDLRSCGVINSSSLPSASTRTFTLSQDATLIVTRAELNTVTWQAAPGTTPTVRIIQLGDAVGGAPACPAATPRGINIEGMTVGAGVTVMLYSPCEVRLSNTAFSGAIYAGSVVSGATSTVTYAPVGIPGWSPGPGTSVPDPGGGGTTPQPPQLGDLVLQRNIDA